MENGLFYLLFLLLPIAMLSGWLSARAHYKANRGKQHNAINPDYFKGLNYLLNEQPDKAIDVFIRLLEVNSDTVETHITLANLFRRRGETERAIRIHQNLIARPTLSSDQRHQALFELGMDYMHAGVLNRAEDLFLELTAISTSRSLAANQQLLRIYQQEKRWKKAIDMAKSLQGWGESGMSVRISQFYCELAEQTGNTDLVTIKPLLRKASSYDPNCVRASLFKATLLIAAEQYRKALKTLQRIEQQNSAYLPEALPLMLTCHTALKSLDVLESWLQDLLERCPNLTTAHIMLAKLIQQQHGVSAAQDCLNKALRHSPSVEGLHNLLSMGEPDSTAIFPLLQNMTKLLMHRGQHYRCSQCGFGGKSLHWLCPSCGQWGTTRPTEIHLTDLETLRETR